MPIELGRRLVAYGIVSAEEVEAALFLAVVRGSTFVRALVDRGAADERTLEEELGRRGGLALRHVVGVPELMARLPPAMCRRLGAIPTRLDSFTGTVDIAAADPLDPHIVTEFGFHLDAPVRVVRAPITAIEEAIRRVELEDSSRRAASESRSRRSTPAFPHGAPNSSLPPPPVEDVPIPLVRRLGLPLIDEETLEEQTRRGEVALPLKNSKARAPGRDAERSRAGVVGAATPAPPRPPGARPSREEPPAVSFPSEPPPPDEEPQLDTIRRPRPNTHTPPTWLPGRPIVAPPPARRSPTPPAGRPAVDIDVPAPREAVPEGVAAMMESGATAADPRSPPWREPPPPPIERRGPPPLPVDARREGPPPLPLADPGTMLRTVRDATSRDEVVRIAIRALRLIAKLVAVFAVKRNAFQGWACNPEFADADLLRAVIIPFDQPSILATATAASIYLGPIPATPAHAPLLAAMETASPDVAVVAVRASGRAVMVLLADELDDTLTGTRRMDELARAAGDALSRLLAGRLSQP